MDFQVVLNSTDQTAQSRESGDQSNYLADLRIYLKSLINNPSYPRIDTTVFPRLDTTIYLVKDTLSINNGKKYYYYYVRLDTGTSKISERPTVNDFVYANVTGSLINGAIFETSDQLIAAQNGLHPSNVFKGPIYIRMDSIKIIGLKEGMPKMNVGSIYKFVIPSPLAYGSASETYIPSYSTLIYDIQLLQIIHDPIAYDSMFVSKWVDSLQLNMVSNSSGKVYIKVDSTSVGDTLKDGDQVKVLYKGKMLDGNRYFTDSTKYDSVTFMLGQNQVIKGWELALHNLRDSCKAEIVVPYSMAYPWGSYNSYGQTVIPEYHSLYFELSKIVHIK